MSRSLKAVLDEAQPQKLPNAAGEVLLGSALLGGSALWAAGAVTSNKLVLPTEAKAAVIVAAFSRAGTLTGYLTPVPAQGGSVTTGLVGVNAAGDIAFASADAVTDAEVLYIPQAGPILEEHVTVSSSEATLNQSHRGLQLLEVEVTKGVTLGLKTLDLRGTSSPASGHVALEVLGTKVKFNSADVVNGSARVKYIAQPGYGAGIAPSLLNRLTALQDAL